jgi:hypothetical protein
MFLSYRTVSGALVGIGLFVTFAAPVMAQAKAAPAAGRGLDDAGTGVGLTYVTQWSPVGFGVDFSKCWRGKRLSPPAWRWDRLSAEWKYLSHQSTERLSDCVHTWPDQAVSSVQRRAGVPLQQVTPLRRGSYGRPGPWAGPGFVNVDPFFAKIIASSFAGSVWLAFFETSWVAPGCS